MRIQVVPRIFGVFLVITLAGCGDAGKMAGPHYEPMGDPYVPMALRPFSSSPQEGGGAAPNMPMAGDEVYSMLCLVCHQADGSGVPMMQPPLADSPILAHDPDDAIRRVLFGVMEGGKGPQKRSEYANTMPAFGQALNDQQVANVVTYARQTFANTQTPITPGQVAEVRAEFE